MPKRKLLSSLQNQNHERFKVEFLKEAIEFLDKLDQKTRNKNFLNIDKAKIKPDNKLLKKLNSEIWEFRTLFN